MQTQHSISAFILFLHVTLFYPGWVLLYNEWPDSHIYQSHLDFYSDPIFWLCCFLIISACILPVVFMKNFKVLFYPKLVDLVLGKKLGKKLDIEEKFKIDMIKLGDEDEQEEEEKKSSDDAFPSQGSNAENLDDRNTLKTGHAISTHENYGKFQNPGAPSEKSMMDCESEIGKVEYEEENNSSQVDIYGNPMMLKSSKGFHSSSPTTNTSSLLKKNYNSGSGSKLISNLGEMKQTRSPAVDRYKGKVREFALNSGPESARPPRSHLKSNSSKKFRTVDSGGDLKFYPGRHSIPDRDTIHEHSEEDKFDIPSDSQRDDISIASSHKSKLFKTRNVQNMR